MAAARTALNDPEKIPRAPDVVRSVVAEDPGASRPEILAAPASTLAPVDVGAAEKRALSQIGADGK